MQRMNDLYDIFEQKKHRVLSETLSALHGKVGQPEEPEQKVEDEYLF